MDPVERFRGSMLGLAVGDALGMPIEFSFDENFKSVTDMLGSNEFGLKPGQWTDDTSLALCLAASIVETGKFHPKDQMERYLKWYKTGYMSSNGKCFDIGNTTQIALEEFEKTREPFSASSDAQAAGNGSIMRLAPVPLAFSTQPKVAINNAAESSRTTHGALEAVDACRYLAALIIGAIQGEEKKDILGSRYSPVSGLWKNKPLTENIDNIAKGSFKNKSPPEIRGTGYVVNCLEAALWAFYNSTSYEEGALLAVNLGDDADTTGAVYGQIAGAFYGASNIPTKWIKKIAHQKMISDLADGLFEFSKNQAL